MSLVNDSTPYSSAELEPGGPCAQRQRELSRQLTRLVDVLYALVLVQGAIYYRHLFTIGDEFTQWERWPPVVLALILIYFTATSSFVDYHLASEDQPYQLLDEGRRGKDLLRFYLDIVIVALYSFLLLKCHVLIAMPAADLTPVLLAYVAMFLLFLFWGRLRWLTKPDEQTEHPFKATLLWLCAGLYAGLAGAYLFVSHGWVANSAFLAAAIAVMLFYRFQNWKQNRTCVEPREKGSRGVNRTRRAADV